VTSLPLALLGLALAAQPLDPETVLVKDVPGPLAADPAAAAWDALPALDVAVGPQQTFRLPDRKANAALAAAKGPRTVKVRAATDGKDLAIVLDWADSTEDRAAGETDQYGDAAAIQFPQRFGAGQRLPYVGMGDPEQPVALYLARAGTDAVTLRWKAGAWRAVFVRPLKAPAHDLTKGLVPLAIAVWDGARSERGGNKALSGWKVLRVERLPADAAYAAELAWGRGPEAQGDLARGKQLVNGMCAACHQTAERKVARAGTAPDLSGIGVVSTPAYLRDSIVAPSTVVVPRKGWFRKDASGKLLSTMPPYASMPTADVQAMVTYLMTLGSQP
jgi:complex iron-sulfur molybdoenzyme family reductase subunit gamma